MRDASRASREGSGQVLPVGESGASVIRPEEKPNFLRAEAAVFERAAKDKKPILLCFMGEGQTAVEATKALHGVDVANLSKDKVVFALVDFNADRTPSLSSDSPVPLSKLRSTNLSREYDIRATPCWVLTDQFGNEFNRFNKAPEGAQLSSKVDEIGARVEAINTRLGKTLDEARKLLDAKDTAGFLKAAMKNFREGVVGVQAQEDTIKAYKKTMSDAQEEVDTILEDRPKNAEKRLKEMLKTFKGTEMYAKVKDAIEIVEG